MGTCAGPVGFGFYRDAYGGALSASAFSEALPAALRVVAAASGHRHPDPRWSARRACAWRRAVCAAADAIAEYGEGRVGGYTIGSLSVQSYASDGTRGRDIALDAALDELAGTGIAFTGAR